MTKDELGRYCPSLSEDLRRSLANADELKLNREYLRGRRDQLMEDMERQTELMRAMEAGSLGVK